MTGRTHNPVMKTVRWRIRHSLSRCSAGFPSVASHSLIESCSNEESGLCVGDSVEYYVRLNLALQSQSEASTRLAFSSDASYTRGKGPRQR